MEKIIKNYKQWVAEHDADYRYDQIFDFVDSKINRGDMTFIMDWFCEHYKS